MCIIHQSKITCVPKKDGVQTNYSMRQTACLRRKKKNKCAIFFPSQR